MTKSSAVQRRASHRSSPTQDVREAIANTKQHNRAYWSRVLRQRAGGTNRGLTNKYAAGSIYQDYSPRELETALLAATWRRYRSKDLRNGVQGFRCHLPGIKRIIMLNDVPPNTTVILDDRKGTGFWSCIVHMRVKGRAVASTILLTDARHGCPRCVLTFHPGSPILQSRVRRIERQDRTITAKDALRLGLKYAKIVSEQKGKKKGKG